MATFPQIVPSSRTFTEGDYPQQRYTTLSGAIWKRSFGNLKIGNTLDLEFQHLSDDKVQEIIEHYYGENGTLNRFQVFYGTIMGGMATPLIQLITLPNGVLWSYAGPPQIESVAPNVHTVRVQLVAEIPYT